jgi:4-guanidinobutyraldehyde dehydrogenase/NAD-dependent aldehyde dehydrogenase
MGAHFQTRCMWLTGGGDRIECLAAWRATLRGRDKSLHAFDKYTELKATWINLSG